MPPVFGHHRGCRTIAGEVRPTWQGHTCDIQQLSRAARHGHEAVVNLLVEKGADVKSKNGVGQALAALAKTIKRV